MTYSEIYVVRGDTGAYSDRKEWLVRAYESERDAEEHVAALRSVAGEDVWWGDGYVGADYDRLREAREHIVESGLDPDCSIDYTGVEYRVERVPFGPLPGEMPRVAK